MTRSTKATKSHSLSRRLVLEQCASDRVGATYVPGKFLAGVANTRQRDGTYSKLVTCLDAAHSAAGACIDSAAGDALFMPAETRRARRGREQDFAEISRRM